MSVYELFADLAVEVARPELAWMDTALCAEVSLDLHFPEKGGDVSAAKRVCMACPVKAPCLEYALEHSERFGVWGGKSEHERQVMRRGRRDAA